MHPFAMETAAILVHSLNRFSLCTKMAAVAVAKLLPRAHILKKRACNSPWLLYRLRSVNPFSISAWAGKDWTFVALWFCVVVKSSGVLGECYLA